nr:ATP-dependent RNA helicase dbp-8-like [Lolium perenne]
MGKKKSTSASDVAKVSRDCSASAISNRDVNKLQALDLISSSEDDIRLPEDDDDDSEETEGVQHVLEDSDVQEDEAAEDDALTRSRRHKQINEDLITTAESSPSGQDNDADDTAPPSPVVKSLTGFFAAEDDLDLSSDDDDDVPVAKRAKLFSGKSESAKESIPSPPIYATVDAVVDFAEQFTRLESENAHLRKVIKTSSDQVLEANRLAANAKNENTSLKDELKRLKRQMKDEQDAKREATAAADKKEGVLRESITNLLGCLSALFQVLPT